MSPNQAWEVRLDVSNGRGALYKTALTNIRKALDAGDVGKAIRLIESTQRAAARYEQKDRELVQARDGA
jgi:hypothetical protein